MKVYHIVYEPAYRSADIHFWTACNLKCRACYTRFETLDFGLYDDPIARIADKTPDEPPQRFLSCEEVESKLKDLPLERAIFIGTEPALDPEMPCLANILHREFGCYNILLTNGRHLAELTDIDEIIFSIKAVSPVLHRIYTGRDNRRILDNFALLARKGVRMQAETVLIPGLIEAAEVERVAEFVAGVDPSITLRIDAYFPVPGCPWRAASRAEVEEAAELARRHVQKVSILTLDMKRTGEKPLRLV
ncbi:MAG: radical SAM protein [Dehalococcoidia bacterium]|nr:radical SAM protein [Dehalococcoidia bacterium]